VNCKNAFHYPTAHSNVLTDSQLDRKGDKVTTKKDSTEDSCLTDRNLNRQRHDSVLAKMGVPYSVKAYKYAAKPTLMKNWKRSFPAAASRTTLLLIPGRGHNQATENANITTRE